jgi:hypothetical protein
MAGTIATLLAAPKTINIVATAAKGQQRHAYKELLALQALSDKTLASPYLKASNVNTIPAHTADCVSGNFTITINFPNYGVAVTTGNIIYNAAAATIQTAVDSALAGSVIVATYVADDFKVVMSGNLNDTVNSCVITSNGTTVNGAYCVVTTANVDLGSNNLSTPVVTTPGTMNRPAEAVLAQQGVVVPASSVTPQGLVPSESDYTLGGNPQSLSPGLQDLLLREIQFSENAVLSAYLRTVIGCV